MIQLNRNRYIVINDAAGSADSFDDINRLMSYLIGKRTHSMTLVVAKGSKACIMGINNELEEFRKLLIKVMAEL